MTVPNSTSKTTAAFFVQAAVAFAISFLAALGGIYFLPLAPWPRLFLPGVERVHPGKSDP
jgi:hypothetical protein